MDTVPGGSNDNLRLFLKNGAAMKSWLFASLAFLLVNIPQLSNVATAEDADLRLTLPSEVFAVPGVQSRIDFDNIVLTQTPQNYRYEVACDIGEIHTDHWAVIPDDTQVGQHNLTVTVRSEQNKTLASASTVLTVVPRNTGSEIQEPIKLLIVGDSLTHASAYPNEIARLLSEPGNPPWRMLGSHKPPSAADGVFHEGYGGWTWDRFATKYEPNPDGTYRKRSSPFVFMGADKNPVLDVARYFEDHCDGKPPEYIVIMLGINDCFGAPPNDLKGIDARIDSMFGHADKLLAAIQQAAPNAEIGLCLTPPPNSRQAAFQANYKDSYTRWGWKRIQHRLIERQLDYVAKKADPRMTVVPTQLNLDPVDGYPENNGVHPNTAGYNQIGTTVYSWLKWRLACTLH
ncbi:MAG: SGNH/GDSL hydrolase family protein [Planctomycetota bacterium]|nr:SGNH/GDSL hydrolase family protein [Planctomycetota bacterium]